MNKSDRKSAAAEGKVEDARKQPSPDAKRFTDSSRPKKELDGKNDSGPEPDVHGQEIPPQE